MGEHASNGGQVGQQRRAELTTLSVNLDQGIQVGWSKVGLHGRKGYWGSESEEGLDDRLVGWVQAGSHLQIQAFHPCMVMRGDVALHDCVCGQLSQRVAFVKPLQRHCATITCKGHVKARARL